MSKYCHTCGKYHPQESFSIRLANTIRLNASCRECLKNGHGGKTTAKNIAMYTEKSAGIRWELFISKGGRCEICGLTKPIPAIFEYHHLDRSQKDFAVSNVITSIAHARTNETRDRWLVLAHAEMDKCIQICANCHKELHHWERNPGADVPHAFIPYVF